MPDIVVLAQYVMGILAALGELQDAGIPSPESRVYLSLGMDLDTYVVVRRVLLGLDYVTISNNQLFLTTQGKKVADVINTEIAKGKDDDRTG